MAQSFVKATREQGRGAVNERLLGLFDDVTLRFTSGYMGVYLPGRLLYDLPWEHVCSMEHQCMHLSYG